MFNPHNPIHIALLMAWCVYILSIVLTWKYPVHEKRFHIVNTPIVVVLVILAGLSGGLLFSLGTLAVHLVAIVRLYEPKKRRFDRRDTTTRES